MVSYIQWDNIFRNELIFHSPLEDLGVSKVFDISQGLLTFLVRSMKCNKVHKDANVKILELFEKIISEQSTKVGTYVPVVIDVL